MIPNPWVILGALAAAVAAVLGAYFYGANVGADKVNVKWQARELQINAASAVAIQAAETKARTAERKSATDLAGVSTAYQQKLRDVGNEKDRIIAGLRANGGLFVDTVRPAPCGSTLSETGTAPAGRDGGSRAELSDAASAFFISEASRADGVAEQLSACQAIIRKDRE